MRSRDRAAPIAVGDLRQPGGIAIVRVKPRERRAAVVTNDGPRDAKVEAVLRIRGIVFFEVVENVERSCQIRERIQLASHVTALVDESWISAKRNERTVGRAFAFENAAAHVMMKLETPHKGAIDKDVLRSRHRR